MRRLSLLPLLLLLLVGCRATTPMPVPTAKHATAKALVTESNSATLYQWELNTLGDVMLGPGIPTSYPQADSDHDGDVDLLDVLQPGSGRNNSGDVR